MNIVVNVPLILWLGTMGAVIGTILSESVVTLYQIYSIKDQLPLTDLFSESWKYCLSALIMFLAIKGIELTWPRNMTSLILEVLFGVIDYVIALFLLRPRILFGYIEPYIERFRHRA